jgi:uncharacterized membrane protein YqaE (UPF0057 family)
METLTFDALLGQEFVRLPEFLTALAVGLLIGLERERNPTAKAGLRTFTLVALVGASSAVIAEKFTAPSIIGVGLGAIAIAIIAAYYHHHEEFHERDPGTTTIVAVIVCYLLAVMVMTGFVQLAVILAILVTALLYFKAELSGVAHGLERRDLISILQFAVVTFVVLPLLPDQGFGPYSIRATSGSWWSSSAVYRSPGTLPFGFSDRHIVHCSLDYLADWFRALQQPCLFHDMHGLIRALPTLPQR